MTDVTARLAEIKARADEVDQHLDAGYTDFGPLIDSCTDIPWLVEQVERLSAAVEAVRALHVRATAYGVAVCTMCAQVKDDDEWDDPDDEYAPVASWVPWPCETIRALDGETKEGA